MNKKIKLLLGVLALGLFAIQPNVLAESTQGTIISIDSAAHSFDIMPPHGDTETASTVKIATAPGVKYIGVDSWEALQAGDFVYIEALSKSKTGGSVEAVSIDRRVIAAENVYAAYAIQPTTQVTTITTTPSIAVQSTSETTQPDGNTKTTVMTTTY